MLIANPAGRKTKAYMKKYFTIILLTTAATAVHAQKSLRAVSNVHYTGGTITLVDSTVYHYGIPSLMELSSNKPAFIEDEFVFNWIFEDPNPDFTTADRFSAQDYSRPMIPFMGGVSKEYNQQLCGSYTIDYGGNYGERYLYTYDVAGNLIERRIQEMSGTPDFQDLEYREFEYNAANQLTVERYYLSMLSDLLVSIDSLFYNQQGQLIQRTNYFLSNDNVSYYQSWLSDFVYSGTDIQYVDMTHRENEGDPFELYSRAVYSYENDLIDSLIMYNYNNGALEAQHDGGYEYFYGTGGLPQTISHFEDDGSIPKKVELEYDADQFVTKAEIWEGSSQAPPVLTTQTHYYYDNIAGIADPEALQLTVAPNPVQNVVTIKMEGTPKRVVVSNANGQPLIVQNGSSDVNVAHLPSGTYYITVTGPNGQPATQPFIKL